MRRGARKLFTASLAIATGLASHVHAIPNRSIARRRARTPIIWKVSYIERYFGKVDAKQRGWLELRIKKIENLRGELLKREATRLVFDYSKKFGSKNLSPELKLFLNPRKKA